MLSFFGGKLSRLSMNFIYLLAIVITIAIFVLNIQYSTFTFSSWYPLVFPNSLFSSLAKIGISLLLIIILGWIIMKLNEKQIIILLILINILSIFIRILIVNGFDNFPVADSWHVFNGANILFFTNDLRPLYIGNYFALYPQQLGIVSILYPLALFFKENINGYYYTQVFLIQLTILLLTLSSYKLKGLKTSLITTLLLNLFVPNYFVPLLIYGDLYAMLFLTIAFTLFVFLPKSSNKRILFVLLGFTCLVFAYLARLSTNVFILAIIFTYIIRSKFNVKMFFRIILLTSIIVLPFSILTKAFDKQDVSLGKYAFPTNTWLRIGLGYSGFDNITPGFHDIKIDMDFQVVSYDVTKMSAINESVIEKQLSSFRNPSVAYDFFKQKATIMWTDPDFEMMTLIIPFKGSKIENPMKNYKEINYGFGALDLKVKTKFGQMLTDNYYTIRKYEKIFLFTILILLLVTFLKPKKDDYLLLFGRLILIGFFLLHLIIEIKSRYVYVSLNALIFIVSLYFIEYFDEYYLKITHFLSKYTKGKSI